MSIIVAKTDILARLPIWDPYSLYTNYAVSVLLSSGGTMGKNFPGM